MGRWTKTQLPTAQALLTPQWLAYTDNSKATSSKQNGTMTDLKPGDYVRVQENAQWKPAKVVEVCEAPRSGRGSYRPQTEHKGSFCGICQELISNKAHETGVNFILLVYSSLPFFTHITSEHNCLDFLFQRFPTQLHQRHLLWVCQRSRAGRHTAETAVCLQVWKHSSCFMFSEEYWVMTRREYHWPRHSRSLRRYFNCVKVTSCYASIWLSVDSFGYLKYLR